MQSRLIHLIHTGEQVAPARPCAAERVSRTEQEDGEAATERGVGIVLGGRGCLPQEAERGAGQAMALTPPKAPH